MAFDIPVHLEASRTPFSFHCVNGNHARRHEASEQACQLLPSHPGPRFWLDHVTKSSTEEALCVFPSIQGNLGLDKSTSCPPPPATFTPALGTGKTAKHLPALQGCWTSGPLPRYRNRKKPTGHTVIIPKSFLFQIHRKK